ncbi:MAG TPA: SMP-30/gluconolactonase/LRE family protein [Caulobacterales bacterium]|nr:SMP-30/gluconolactonase/LRE family protein [Caulobacterales bacterium]
MRTRLLAFIVAGLAAIGCAAAQSARNGDRLEAAYPEGPIWQGDKLYYAEMGADRVSVFENGAAHVFFTQRGCGPTALAPYGGGFLVLCHLGARLVAVDEQGREVRRWERDDEGNALRDPNDGYADGQGGVYFSDPGIFSSETRAHGYVDHLSADGALKRVAGPLWYPNGVYVEGGQVYVDEHMAHRVLRYDIAADGGLANRQVFADLNALVARFQFVDRYPEAGPDGLERGPDGAMYVAIYGEGRILRLAPNGAYLGSIRTPGRYVTNIAFNAAGDAATTASFDNLNPPFPGEVRFFSAAALTGARR